MGLEPASFGAVVVIEYPTEERKAAITIAARIAAQHPTRYDDTDPALAGRVVAHTPAARHDLLQLLDALGFTTTQTGGTPR